MPQVKKKQFIPEGWTQKEIQDLAVQYDTQSEEDAIAEMEDSLRCVPIETALFRRINDLAREKKTSVEKLINSMLRKNLSKAA